MQAFLKRLRKNTKGNILVMVGAGTAALVGSAGIAVDAVQWYLWKRQMQQTVDSGSMSAALALWRDDDWENSAQDTMAKAANSKYVIEKLTNPPDSGAYADDDLAIEIIATTSAKLPFSSVFMADPAVIRVRSVATAIGDGEYCVVSLRQSGTGINVSGTANLDLGCGMVANSQSAGAITLSGSSYVIADPISAVGGVTYSDGNLAKGTSVRSYAPVAPDPMADRELEVPQEPSKCDYTNHKSSNKAVTNYKPSVSGVPVRFCGGLSIAGQANFAPGVYIIDGGTFDLGNKANVAGTGVTFVLTGKTPATVATMDVNAQAKVKLSPPDDADNEWDGVLVFQDPMGSTKESILNGGSDIDMEGIIYMPKGDMRYNGNSEMGTDCLMLIGYTLNFMGTYDLVNDFSDCPFDASRINNKSRVIRVVE